MASDRTCGATAWDESRQEWLWPLEAPNFFGIFYDFFLFLVSRDRKTDAIQKRAAYFD